MRLVWLAAASLVALGAGSACSGTENPPALGGDCPGIHCQPVDGGVIVPMADGSASHDAGCADAGDAAPFMGTMATLTGGISHSSPPSFPPFPASSPLSFAATVHFDLGGAEYVGSYTPGSDGGAAGSFSLQSPPGAGFLFVSDVAGQNGVLDTGAGVTIASGDVFALPAVSRAELDAIYAAQTPPLTRDPTKSQIIFSMQTSPINGSLPVAGVAFTLPGTKDATLYDAAGGVFARGAATGPAGVAIIVNYAELGCVGTSYHFAYTANGKSVNDLTFLGMQGKVVRVPVELASM